MGGGASAQPRVAPLSHLEQAFNLAVRVQMDRLS